MKKRYVVVFGILFQAGVYAQQVPSYSQYMDNIFVINPGAAGAYGISVLNMSSRQQWIGIDGAPRTTSVSFQGRILKKGWLLKNTIGLLGMGKKYTGKTSGKVGMGGMVYSDRVGLIRRTGFQYSYAYHIHSGQTQFSGGLTAHLYQMHLNQDNIIMNTPGDPYFSYSERSIFVPDFNAGIFMTNRSFYAGISANSLFQSALKMGNDQYKDYHLYRYYYAIAGYTFYLKKFYLEPSILYKTTIKYGNQVDFSARLTFNNTVWAGMSFRTNGDFVGLVGVRVSSVYIGYAYDYSTSSFRFNSFGTHEVSISYKMGSIERRYRWQERY